MLSLHRDQSGTGLIGTVAGVTAFLFLLLFSVQVAATLHARSVTTAAGYDAARSVAAATVDHDDPVAVGRAVREAEARFRDLLGALGDDADLVWDLSDGSVRLRVAVVAPSVLPTGIGDATGLRRIERSFVVRTERLQPT